jgi:hypothetical protein
LIPPFGCEALVCIFFLAAVEKPKEVWAKRCYIMEDREDNVGVAASGNVGARGARFGDLPRREGGIEVL